MIDLRLGDCLEIMPQLEAQSFDAIIADIPYGTTACKWDTVISFEPMWENLKRLAKLKAAIVLFGSQPFTSALVMSNVMGFAFSWIWDKGFGANFVQANRQPLKTHEDIIVFTRDGRQPNYYPQKITRTIPIKKGGNKQSKAIPIARTQVSATFGLSRKIYEDKCPTSQLRFSCREDRGLHPTQKPVALMEYLVKTYTNEGDTVLDFTMGSGTTGIACINTRRNFVGIEKESQYFVIAQKRIAEAQAQLSFA